MPVQQQVVVWAGTWGWCWEGHSSLGSFFNQLTGSIPKTFICNNNTNCVSPIFFNITFFFKNFLSYHQMLCDWEQSRCSSMLAMKHISDTQSTVLSSHPHWRCLLSFPIFPCGLDTTLPCIWWILDGVERRLTAKILCFFFKFYFIFKLYITVLDLPNIKMHPPQVYMCSPLYVSIHTSKPCWVWLSSQQPPRAQSCFLFPPLSGNLHGSGVLGVETQ